MKNKQIKISRKAAQFIMLAIILIAVAGYVYLGITYNDEQGNIDDLEAKIAPRQDKLAEMEEEREGLPDLSDVLKNAEEELATAKARFPYDQDSTDVTETLLRIASVNKVDILPIANVSKPTSKTIEGNKYNVVSFQLSARGNFAQVLAFINALENGDIDTITVGDVNLNGSGDSWTARLSGSLYSRAQEATDSGE